MGLLDFFTGESPSQDITPTSTLTPEQEELLRKLIEQISGAGDAEGLGPSNLELTSLSGLEGIANEAIGLLDSGTGQQTAQAGLGALNDIFTSGPQDIDDFFNETVRDPLLEDFQDDILGIGSRRAGDFFGGERVELERNSQESLIDALTRERARTAFGAREGDLNRIIQGLGVLPGAVGSEFGGLGAASGILSRTLGAGGTERNIVQQQLDERNRRIREALASIGLPAQENIVFNNPGSSGLISDAISAFSSGVGSGFGVGLGGSFGGQADEELPRNRTFGGTF